MTSTGHNEVADGPGGTDTAHHQPDPAYRTTLSYVDLSRRFYAAQGYEVPYRWATNFDAPFTVPTVPPAEANVALVTTSFPVADGEQPPKSVYAAPTQPSPAAMYTADVFWHKTATHTDDVESFLPLGALAAASADGTIGRVNERFYGVPTSYSQRRTVADAKQIEVWCREDKVDLVLLVPI